MTRSNLHVVTGHDGSTWMDDALVEGDFTEKVREMLGGEPDRSRELFPGMSRAFYRGRLVVLVMTFGPEVEREQAETLVHRIRTGREDLN